MTPGNLIAWINDHYDIVESPLLGPHLVCKRCQQRVGYTTKHAAVRHGDDVEVMPAVNLKLARDY